jgi:hypothetical protein
MKGVRAEPVLIFAEDLQRTLDEIKSKFLPAGDEAEVRSKATLREPHLVWATVENPALNQPRFEAHFMTEESVNCILFLPEIPPEFSLLREDKIASGDVVGQKKFYFRLHDKGPPAIYKLVRSAPYIPPTA